MNWETAKTWLIGMFLILDILLGWQYFSARAEMRGYAESYPDLLANTRTLLAEHNFSLATSVPTKRPDMAPFSARVGGVSLAEAAKAAFAGKPAHRTKDGGLEAAGGQVNALGKGAWTVEYTHPVSYDAKHPEQLLDRMASGSAYAFDGGAGEQDVLVFDQLYGGKYPIFDATIVVDVSGNGAMTGYQQTVLTDIHATSNPKPIISALDALNSLGNAVDNSGQEKDNTIVEIDLGYLSSPSGSGSATGANHYWFPVWRILTDTGVYYVNAFTGELNM
ncbi:MAG: two-component system regulatory protein YycI [Alicyclobacillus herbarius]|uniref:two-component system regulatory protein YycI n=1 Tax=Alicyclobacillus herbarius TaxID=122960 RepID=UPI0023578D41|nr:two-component system regulatory protein YycI [Alicyclobacillus herbarius]MCL6631752.1 two-component system regulatory protein YycI [Alicyclobacillus herbarius]